MDDCLEDLESKHRKEKKELQAQVQALKKLAKNDKTKKKELSNDIAKLELDLQTRHQQELDLVQNKYKSSVVLESVPALNKEIDKVKISKAQKRRDKKTQQERERNELIKLQEEENITGSRNVEKQAIALKLKEKKLKIFPIPSDGDCLYKAVSHQLQHSGRATFTVDELRKNVANYVRNNKDDFLPFMTNPETDDMLDDSQFEDYCEKIENTKTWGGQLEIRALSNCLQCPIHVIQSTGLDCIEQGNEFGGNPLVITYHRHMYKLGAHYNSTQVIDSEDENEES